MPRKTKTDKEPLGDTIERANWLIRHKRIWQEGEVWRAFSERPGVTKPYTITAAGCDCYAGGHTRKEKFCKHYYAALAPHIVALIMAIRSAGTLEELSTIGSAYAKEVAGYDAALVHRARTEYASRREALRG